VLPLPLTVSTSSSAGGWLPSSLTVFMLASGFLFFSFAALVFLLLLSRCRGCTTPFPKRLYVTNPLPIFCFHLLSSSKSFFGAALSCPLPFRPFSSFFWVRGAPAVAPSCFSLIWALPFAFGDPRYSFFSLVLDDWPNCRGMIPDSILLLHRFSCLFVCRKFISLPCLSFSSEFVCL